MKKTLVLIVFQGEQIWFLSRSFFRRGQKNWFWSWFPFGGGQKNSFFQAWEQKTDSDFFQGRAKCLAAWRRLQESAASPWSQSAGSLFLRWRNFFSNHVFQGCLGQTSWYVQPGTEGGSSRNGCWALPKCYGVSSQVRVLCKSRLILFNFTPQELFPLVWFLLPLHHLWLRPLLRQGHTQVSFSCIIWVQMRTSEGADYGVFVWIHVSFTVQTCFCPGSMERWKIDESLKRSSSPPSLRKVWRLSWNRPTRPFCKWNWPSSEKWPFLTDSVPICP